MKTKVNITQDRLKPFGYTLELAEEINGLTFKTESIHSLENIESRGFEIVSRKDWIDGLGYYDVKTEFYFTVKDLEKNLGIVKAKTNSQLERAVMQMLIENYCADDCNIDKGLNIEEINRHGVEIEAQLFNDDPEPTEETIFIEPVLLYE